MGKKDRIDKNPGSPVNPDEAGKPQGSTVTLEQFPSGASNVERAKGDDVYTARYHSAPTAISC